MQTKTFKELAELTTLDISHRKIKLSIEEKTVRTKEFFQMIKDFEKKRNAKCAPALFETLLLPQYIIFSSSRLTTMFNWLVLNWRQYSRPFPEIPDFEQARKETAENIPRNTWEEYENKEYSPKELTEAFKEVKKALHVYRNKT